MNSSRATHENGVIPRSTVPARSRWNTGCRLVCHLTTLHPERALSRALAQHLSHEMPDIEFVLEPHPETGAVWVCGFESGREDLVRGLRLEYPDAFVVVTGRGPVESWEEGVRNAGADYVCSWPVPYADLSRILHHSRKDRSVPT